MIYVLKSRRIGGTLAGVLAVSLVALPACNTAERLSPPTEAGTPENPAGSLDNASDFVVTAVAPGIAFASFGLTPAQIGTVHTGSVPWTDPSVLLSLLSQFRAKGGRVIIQLQGSEKYSRNADGTFNLTKWKSMVDRYKSVNFSSYINDGTIVGHYLIDEPQYPSRWGGKVIPQATVEAMAKYSKQLWPTMITMVNAPPRWLAAAPVTYTYLDAAWALYIAGYGSTSYWIGKEVAAAKTKGLGVVVALNVLDGGNGSSGIHGTYGTKWSMSASELRSYGSALLTPTYGCGFVMWKYTSSYYSRTDIKSAMTALSTQSKSHVKTSCRQGGADPAERPTTKKAVPDGTAFLIHYPRLSSRPGRLRL
jgi:hypothetical protein